ncbi:hypothetical protein Tco_1143724 [Tanacetum coccineum]
MGTTRPHNSQDEVFSTEWHLKEIHVTLTHLEKKQTRLRIYTKSLEESFSQSVEMASGNGYPRRGQNRSENDKTEHENGKTMRSQKDKVKVNKKVKVKVNPEKWH